MSEWMGRSRVSGVAACRGAAMLGSFGGVQACTRREQGLLRRREGWLKWRSTLVELKVHQNRGGTRSTPNLLKTIRDGGGMIRGLSEHCRRGDDAGTWMTMWRSTGHAGRGGITHAVTFMQANNED